MVAPCQRVGRGRSAAQRLARFDRLKSCGCRFGGEDRAAYDFRDLRDDRVAESPQSVHPSGNPMSHSTHAGFRAPPTAAFSGRLLRSICDGGPLLEASCVVGVGHQRTASPKLLPKPLPLMPRALCRARRASMVAKSVVSPVSITAGVGHDPEAVALVRRTNGGSGYAVPLSIVPERGQVPENDTEASPEKRGDILHEDVAGSNLANEAGVFDPEATALTREPFASASDGDILAGKSAANNVDCSDMLGLQLSNVAVDGNVGPMLGKDAARELLDLAEGHRLESSRPL